MLFLSFNDDIAFIKFRYLSIVPGVAGEDTELLCFVMLELV